MSDTVPTPAEHIAAFLLWPREKQERYAEHVMRAQAEATRCWQRNHEEGLRIKDEQIAALLKRITELETGISAAVAAYMSNQR